MRGKAQLVVRRGEEIAAAAEAQAEVATSGQPLGLKGLAAAAGSTARAALAQAATYERWARDAAAADPLLARSVDSVARRLRELAGHADELRGEAQEALAAAEDEDAAGDIH